METNISKERLKELAEIVFIVHDEHIPVEGNVIDSGDDKFDKKVERSIKMRLLRGDTYAWFTAEVRVEFGELSSDPEYLGCCSYKNREDFMQSGGYYDDMVETCIDNLIRKINEFQASILSVTI